MPTNQICSLLLDSVDVVDEVFYKLGEDDWERPTPCAHWCISQVFNHLTGTAHKALGILAGAHSYADQRSVPTGEIAGVTLQERWFDASLAIRELACSVDMTREVDTAMGEQTLGEVLAVPIADLAIHAWDIAAGAGKKLELPRQLVAYIKDTMAAQPEENLRAPGLFGPAQPAPADATETEKLMAWLGRTIPR